jgi:phosphoribosylformimino-5-aminoimidazole carboxamide ribonucleotide (ProFAR) isomerase
MRTVELWLDDAAQERVTKAAWGMKVRRTKAVELLLVRGLRQMEQAAEKWEAQGADGTLDKLKELQAEKEDLVRELMEVEGRMSSFDFAVYEEFKAMSDVLIVYSGRRAQAKLLESQLESRGLFFDLSPGKAPNYDELATKYLYRKEDKRNNEVSSS